MVAKKETPSTQEPTNLSAVEPAAAPVSQAVYPDQQYAAQGYAPAYVNPNKGKAKWLTFEYILALGSLVASVLLSVHILLVLFSAWSGGSLAVSTEIGGWPADLLGLGTITSGTGAVTAAVAATLFGVVSYITFGRVSKAIPDRPDYTKRTAYKVATYGAFAMLLVPVLVMVAKLAGALISSLLFIGVSGAGVIYKSLYLMEFLPYSIGLGLVVSTLFFVSKIIQGLNKSKLAALIALIVAGALLIGVTITTAVQVRDTASSRGSSSTTLPSYDFGSGSGQYKIPTLNLDDL